MRSSSLKPLINLAAAAVIAGSAPDWGAHLLSSGFTHALRTIQSAETVKAAAEKRSAHRRAFLTQDAM
jgi:hypothetical protein